MATRPNAEGCLNDAFTDNESTLPTSIHHNTAKVETVTETPDEEESSKNITDQSSTFKREDHINKEEHQMEDGLHITSINSSKSVNSNTSINSNKSINSNTSITSNKEYRNGYGVANETIIIDEPDIGTESFVSTQTCNEDSLVQTGNSFSSKTRSNDRKVSTDDGLKEKATRVKTPDEGGWGWFIVLSSMIIHVIIGGIDRSGGILFLKFEEKFHASAAVTAWVPSICSGLRLSLGPMVSALCNRYSYRTVIMCSGIVLGFSAMISAFAPNLYFLFLSYGVIGGIGNAMAYCPGVVIVSLYFHKKLGTAVGLATSGVGLGAFSVPLLLEASFLYYGYIGSFVLLSGLFLELIVCGALMRPMSIHRRITDMSSRKNHSRVSVISTLELEANGITRKITRPNGGVANEVDIEITVNNRRKRRLSKPRKSSVVSFVRRMSTAVLFLNKFEKTNRNTKPKAKAFDFSLLKDMRYCAFCVAILFFTVAFQSGFVFLPAFAKQIGASDFEAAYTLVISGLCDGFGRLVAGFLFDTKYIKPYRVYIYNFMMVMMGVLSFCIPSATNFVQLACMCAVYGFIVGMYVSQKSVIIVDLLGPEKLSHSFGILLLFQGIGAFIGPPFTGLLKDINGMYDYAFYFGGSGVLLGSLVLTVTNSIHYIQTRQSDQM